MDKDKIYNLIEECRNSFLELNKNFSNSKRIEIIEKEERFYKERFKQLGINPQIVPSIYEYRSDNGGIQVIKNNIETKILVKEAELKIK